MKLFLDVNVILDVLKDRQPFAEDSAAVLERIENGDDRGVVCALTFPILHYLLTGTFSSQASRKLLRDLRTILAVAKVDAAVIDRALNSEINDFEDGIQYFSALNAESDALITRNPRDFPEKSIKIFTPSEYRAFLDNIVN